MPRADSSTAVESYNGFMLMLYDFDEPVFSVPLATQDPTFSFSPNGEWLAMKGVSAFGAVAMEGLGNDEMPLGGTFVYHVPTGTFGRLAMPAKVPALAEGECREPVMYNVWTQDSRLLGDCGYGPSDKQPEGFSPQTDQMYVLLDPGKTLEQQEPVVEWIAATNGQGGTPFALTPDGESFLVSRGKSCETLDASGYTMSYLCQLWFSRVHLDGSGAELFFESPQICPCAGTAGSDLGVDGPKCELMDCDYTKLELRGVDEATGWYVIGPAVHDPAGGNYKIFPRIARILSPVLSAQAVLFAGRLDITGPLEPSRNPTNGDPSVIINSLSVDVEDATSSWQPCEAHVIDAWR